MKQVLFAAAALAATAVVAAAQPNCAARTEVVERLQSKYSEVLVARGLQGTGQAQRMVEVWASGQTGTFTVILTNPQGLSCVAATGTDFFQREPNSRPQGEDM